MTPTTQIKDSLLVNVSPDHSRDVVEAVEWAAVEDTGLAIRDARTFPNFDEYMASFEVAL